MKVERRLIRQRRDTSPMRQKGQRFLLSGLLKCGHCGYAMIGYHWNRKKTGERRKMYTCSSHHFQGKKVCTRNTIPEASLVDCVVRIIQERYLSENNLDKLRKAIGQQQRTQALPQHELHDEDGIKRRNRPTPESCLLRSYLELISSSTGISVTSTPESPSGRG